MRLGVYILITSANEWHSDWNGTVNFFYNIKVYSESLRIYPAIVPEVSFSFYFKNLLQVKPVHKI